MNISKQQGALTLFMVLVLLVLMTSWSLLVWRFNATETLISSSEARAMEALQAADGGLEYAIGWLGANPWCAGDAPPSVPLVDVDTSVADNYEYTIALSVSESSDYPGAGLINVTATATGPDGTNIAATASRSLIQSKRDINTFTRGSPPPLVINGCLSGVTGSPDLYPAVGEAALHTSSSDTSSACVDFGHFSINRETGDTASDAANPSTFSGSAWNYVFNVSKADIQTLSDAQAAAGLDADSDPPRTAYWIDSSNSGSFLSGGNWHDSVGSADYPVVLAFDDELGCPKINGNPTIYGIVYYETNSACATNGWGGATVYGSVVHEGNVEKHTANAEIYSASRMTGDSCLKWPIQTAAWIPGTWRDM